MQEFVPTYKRGWVAGLTTTLLPAGNVIGAISGAYLAPTIGWRSLFLVGLAPAVLVLMIRYWVPESPRFLMQRCAGVYPYFYPLSGWVLRSHPTPPPGENVVALKRHIPSLLDSLSTFRRTRIFGLVFGARILPWIRWLRGDLKMTSSL